MRLVLLMLFVFPASVLFADKESYTFLGKAEAHYKSIISSSLENKGGKKVIDSLLMISPDSINFYKAFNISFEIGLFMLEEGNHGKALDIFNDMRYYMEARINKKKEDQKKISALYNVIGAIYEETGLWNDALAMYMNSLQICNEIDYKAGRAKVYNNIGKLYYSRDELNKAEELFNKAIAINKLLDIRPELFNNYNNLAGIYMLRHNSDKALQYALFALNQLDMNKDFYNFSISYSNIGSLYQDMGNFQVALSYYMQAADLQEKKSFQLALLGSYLSISSLYQSKSKDDSASYYIIKALKLSERINNPSQKLLVLKAAAKNYEKIRNFEKAYNFYSSYVILNDSLEALNSLTKIEQIQAVYEVINKEKDNKILQQTINIQKLAIQRQRIVLIGVILLFLLFIYLVFSLIHNNRREREKNQMIVKQGNLLHQQEKDLLVNKEKTLELELDYKNRQLTSYALHMVRNNEFVFKTTEELKTILLGMSSKDKDRADKIRNLISDLQQYSGGHDWEEFRLYFEEVHQSFEKNLNSAFPNLSPNDKKICALLKLGLSTKEIASITFRELRSVESARNRLRKKMGLAADVNIHSFLSQF